MHSQGQSSAAGAPDVICRIGPTHTRDSALGWLAVPPVRLSCRRTRTVLLSQDWFWIQTFDDYCKPQCTSEWIAQVDVVFVMHAWMRLRPRWLKLLKFTQPGQARVVHRLLLLILVVAYATFTTVAVVDAMAVDYKITATSAR